MSFYSDIDDISKGQVQPEKPLSPAERKARERPVTTTAGPVLSPSGIKATAEHGAKEMAEAFWSNMERNTNAAAEIMGNGIPNPLNFLKAGMKLMLPNEVVENIFGVSKDFYKGIARDVLPKATWPDSIKEPGTEEEFVKAYKPKKGAEGMLTERFVGDVGPAPGAFSKYLVDPLARGVGYIAGQPVGGAGSVAKNLIMSMGASEVGELLGKVGGRLGRAVAGEAGEEVGSTVGSLAGSAAGGQLNIARVKGTGTILGKAGQEVKTLTKAIRSTLSPETQDKRDFFTRFTDNYKNLSKTTASYYDSVVAEHYANAIRNTPGAKENIEKFDRMAAEVGIDRSKANLGQRTLVPALTEEVSYFEPKSEEQATGKATQEKGLQGEVQKAYQQITGHPPSGKRADITLSLNRTRYHILSEMEARGHEAMDVMKRSPRLTPAETEVNGASLKDAFEAEQKDAQGQFMRLYNGTYRAADAAGVQVKVKDTVQQGLKKLMTVEVGMEPSVGYDLQHAIGVSQKRLNSLTFKEAHDIVKVLGREANLAKTAGDSTKERLLSSYREALLEDMKKATYGSKDSPGPARYVWQQFEGTNQAYRDKFVPRFETGINYNIDRQAGRTRKNTDYIRDSEVFNSPKGYLATINGRVPEENMKQFDYTFGGVIEGTKKNPAAYQALGKSLESEYATKVYGPKDAKGRMEFDEAKHNKFMQDYEAAFNRVPEVAQKLHQQAMELSTLKMKAEISAAKWKAITSSPLTKTLEKPEADRLVSEALSNPSKMARLIKATGGKDSKALYEDIMARGAPWVETKDGIEYEPSALYKMLQSGAGLRGQGVSSLQVLARATYGKERGDKHIENLKSIAAIALRQASTDPRMAGSSALVNPSFLSDWSGQSGAQWISARKSMAEHRTSVAWFTTQAVGRFLRQHVTKGIQVAKYKALFDPEYSEAVAELSKTPAGTPISARTAKVLAKAAGKEGKGLYEELVNLGYVRSAMTRGAAIGLQQKEDEDK